MKKTRFANTRRVTLAGTDAEIEGDPADPYFQNIEVFAAGMMILPALISRHIPSDSLVLDVGANIGLSTIALARACPNGQVIAFEPSPRNVGLLRRNLLANHITNVLVIQVAVSDQEGELHFHEANFGAGSHVVTNEHLASHWATVRVPMTTLDIAMKQAGAGPVAFAKIDAEGHEPNILTGARHLLARDRPLLFMEFNAWCLNAFGGHSPAAFARALWAAFEVSRANPDGTLSAIGADPISFLHENLTQHGCVDDLVLRLQLGAAVPSLMDMSWPANAVASVNALRAQT